MTVIGIDPGITGGLSWLGSSVSSIPVPISRREGIRYPLLDHSKIDRWFESCAIAYQEIPTLCVIEDVHSMPRDSKQGAFTFGFTTGGIVSYFASLNLELVTVSPREWQKAILNQDVADVQREQPTLTSREVLKASSIRFVKRTFPGVSLIPTPRSRNEHSGISDSICIALYGMERFGRV